MTPTIYAYQESRYMEAQRTQIHGDSELDTELNKFLLYVTIVLLFIGDLAAIILKIAA